jgi:hypothetical protein
VSAGLHSTCIYEGLVCRAYYSSSKIWLDREGLWYSRLAHVGTVLVHMREQQVGPRMVHSALCGMVSLPLLQLDPGENTKKMSTHTKRQC